MLHNDKRRKDWSDKNLADEHIADNYQRAEIFGSGIIVTARTTNTHNWLFLWFVLFDVD